MAIFHAKFPKFMQNLVVEHWQLGVWCKNWRC